MKSFKIEIINDNDKDRFFFIVEEGKRREGRGRERKGTFQYFFPFMIFRKCFKSKSSKVNKEQLLEKSSNESKNRGIISLPCSVGSNGVMNELSGLIRGDEIHDCPSFLLDVHQGR